METTQNNKLIAEFMGYNLEIVNNEFYFTHDDMLESLSDEELHFDTDWNWLMEVVEKIENLGFDVVINYNICTITNGENEFRHEVGQKIYATYQAVIEFINWYNEKK